MVGEKYNEGTVFAKVDPRFTTNTLAAESSLPNSNKYVSSWIWFAGFFSRFRGPAARSEDRSASCGGRLAFNQLARLTLCQ